MHTDVLYTVTYLTKCFANTKSGVCAKEAVCFEIEPFSMQMNDNKTEFDQIADQKICLKIEPSKDQDGKHEKPI